MQQINNSAPSIPGPPVTSLEQKTVRWLERCFRLRLAFKQMEHYGVKIEEDSRLNQRRLMQALLQGHKHLAEHIAPNSQVQGLTEEEIVQLPTERGLSEGEIALYNFIVSHLTIKHYTKKTFESLLSPQERERRGIASENRRTARGQGDDNIFFVVGVGDHQTPFDRRKNVESGKQVVGDLSLLSREKHFLDALWIGGHLYDYNAQHSGTTTILGDSLFSYKLYPNSKTYIYQRVNGLIFERLVPFNREVFQGRNVMPAIALQAIEHLRFIGGSYRKHIEETFASDLSDEQKLPIAESLMKAVMPSWVYPEAKYAVEFPLNREGIGVEKVKSNSPLSKEAKRMRAPLLQFGIAYAASPLTTAIRANDLLEAKRLTEIVQVDVKDEMVRYKIDLNEELEGTFDTYLRIACKFRRNEIVKLLVHNGADPKLRQNELLMFLAYNQNLEIFKFLSEQGARFDNIHLQSPLMIFAEQGNIDGLTLAMQYDRVLDRQYYCLEKTGYGLIRSSPENGYSALHYAIKNDNTEAAIALIKNGANIHLRAENGDTPYSLAHQQHNTVLMSLLIENKANIDLEKLDYEECINHQYGVAMIVTGKNRDGQPVVLMGKKRDASGLVSKNEYLFPGGLKDPEDSSFLAAAIRETQEETGLNLSKFIDSGLAIPKKVHDSHIITPSGEYHYHVVIFHVDLGEYFSDQFVTASDDLADVRKIPIASIIENGEVYGAERYSVTEKKELIPIKGSNGLLLAKVLETTTNRLIDSYIGEEISREHVGPELLIRAIREKNSPIINRLLDYGIPIQGKDHDALAIAVETGDCELVKLLIERGADINHLECQALNQAVRKNDIELFRYLLNQNALQGKYLSKVVYFALDNTNCEFAQVVLESSKLCWNHDEYTYRALKAAVENGYNDLAREIATQILRDAVNNALGYSVQFSFTAIASIKIFFEELAAAEKLAHLLGITAMKSHGPYPFFILLNEQSPKEGRKLFPNLEKEFLPQFKQLLRLSLRNSHLAE